VPDADDRPDDAVPAVGESHPTAIEPLDVDGVGAILYGTLAWGLALVGCLLLRDRLAADGRGWWTGVCLAGFLLGLPGLWFVRRRRAAYVAHR